MRISPMLADTAQKPFESREHIFEPKLDGVRCIASVNGKLLLQSRSGHDITRKFPELANMWELVVKPCVLDGEIICSNFTGISERIHKENLLDINVASRVNPATFYVFDILEVDSESVMNCRLIERKKLLSSIFRADGRTRPLAFYNDGVKLWEQVVKAGGEGIMAKAINSTYIPGKRSSSWLKIKAFQEDTFYIVGLTQGENSRGSTFGALVLARHGNMTMEYVGCAGSGLTQNMLKRILQAVTPSDCCYLVSRPHLDKPLLTWVKPHLQCEVRFLGTGSNGHLRFPTFRGLKGR